MKWMCAMILAVSMFALTGTAFGQSAEKKFSEQVGQFTVGPVSTDGPTVVPFITWGAEYGAFQANGNSLTTQDGSTFKGLGLNLKFVDGNDYVQQVKDYMEGRTAFGRGTMRMLGQASEVLGSDPKTKPVVILQLSYSLGDHIVFREPTDNQAVTNGKTTIKTPTQLTGLKGKTICLQRGGPHVGLVDDSLKSAGLKWSDVTIVWVADLTGPNGPAEAMRKNPKIDAACVITPDMIGLCSDLTDVGQGAEGTIKGARVINSTSVMSRSIADVWYVRSDFYNSAAGKAICEKFVAGYFAGSKQVSTLRKNYEANHSFTQGTGAEYKKLLQFAQKTFTAEVLPTLEEDAHGLVLDAALVGLTGNISFFTDAGNLNGFDAKQKSALDLATTEGYATERRGFDKAAWDYKNIATLAKIEYVAPSAAPGRIKAEGLDVFPDTATLDANTIVSFTISFQPNQTTFSADTYGAEFQRALKAASDFGNAVIVVRGHSDTTKVLSDLVRAGLEKGVLKRTGSRQTGYKYTFNNKAIDLTNMVSIIKLIESGAFDGATNKPRQTMQAALNLSQSRAVAVRDALLAFAKNKNVVLDITQLQPVGAGITAPVIPKPTKASEALQNMRVEFRIVRVKAENINPDAFDF